jgi:hypothetical protein
MSPSQIDKLAAELLAVARVGLGVVEVHQVLVLNHPDHPRFVEHEVFFEVRGRRFHLSVVTDADPDILHTSAELRLSIGGDLCTVELPTAPGVELYAALAGRYHDDTETEQEDTNT